MAAEYDGWAPFPGWESQSGPSWFVCGGNDGLVCGVPLRLTSWLLGFGGGGGGVSELRVGFIVAMETKWEGNEVAVGV